MNRLAGDDVTFKRAYCQAPICAPSRVSFLSGLRPSTPGSYALGSRLSNHPVYGDGLHKAIHESFKDAGYTTASIGKVYHSSSELGPGVDQGNGSHSYAPQPATKLTSPDSYLKVMVEPGGGGQSFRHSTVPGRDYRFQTSGTLSGWTTDPTRTPAPARMSPAAPPRSACRRPKASAASKCSRKPIQARELIFMKFIDLDRICLGKSWMTIEIRGE
jgi:arylsulfatase A-like enzyme